MRTYAPTAAAAYHSRKHENQTEAEYVLATIRKARHGLTILEIAQRTGLQSSTVSGRLGELRKSGQIEEAPFKRRCSVNGMLKKIWAESPATGQLRLRMP
jgi:predicted transcriptional regulator